MKRTILAILAAMALVVGMTIASAAQQSVSGTINTLTVNPRQNADLTGSTGTETGQPNDEVPGSQGQPNGLIPVTTNMVGSGSNGNLGQSVSSNKSAAREEAHPAATTAKETTPKTPAKARK